MRFTKASAVFIILFCLILTCHAATDSFASGETEEAGYVYGVVRDINPSLGYITLYNTDGSGISPIPRTACQGTELSVLPTVLP